MRKIRQAIFVFAAVFSYEDVRAEEPFLWVPIRDEMPVTCDFCGYRYRSGGCHGAIDIDTTDSSTRIYSAAAGDVIHVTATGDLCRRFPYGTYVVIEHDNDYRTMYAHLQPGSVAVAVGDIVEAGAYLGIGDTSGCAWGSHLHFEVRDPSGNRVDPYDGSEEQQAMCLPNLPTEECGENALWVSCPPEPYDSALAADTDLDGFTVVQGDCDDGNRDVNPDAPERCDGIDNNCRDGADENFIILGDLCTAGIGECQAGGAWQCNSTRDDVACSAIPSDPPATTDIPCDGLDNDCNGDVDETPFNCPADMARIPGMCVCIDRYENSRPNATAAESGIGHYPNGVPMWDVPTDAVPQSVPGVMPWDYISWGGVVEACGRAGKRPCLAVEWQAACRGAEDYAYSYGDTYIEGACSVCTDLEVGPMPAGSFSDCVTPDGVYDLIGNMKEIVWDDRGTATYAAAGLSSLDGGCALEATCDWLEREHDPNCLDVIPPGEPGTWRDDCAVVALNAGFRCCWSP